ncbi:hypothetical protein [Clostridium gasigenes]|uniref:Uncharacterized protein n=1 Tax=Clostridium gasigenes TaxID=94869 RepID=A0A7X0SIT0_9CLOT|nr:hypothetical protein [Clostridium gasigenes]MBB6716246.1 hypothetical protein [Clostridium gasigenes]
MEIIRNINSTVISNGQMISAALKDLELNRINGIYLGEVANFKEYDPSTHSHEAINNMASTINTLVIGPLDQLYDGSDDVGYVRRIVILMVLALHHRALICSELKNTYNDNRDDHLLVQLKRLKECCKWVQNNQNNRNVVPTMSVWRDCELTPHPGTVCLPIPHEDEPLDFPTSCCSDHYYAFEAERKLLKKDIKRLETVDESISHLEN